MADQEPYLADEREVEVDAETSAAIARGIRAAEDGRTVLADEVPALISSWISKLSTQTQR